jgi:opacity protein-like surface antigen
MFKKTAIALTLLSLSLTAIASDWQVGGGFSKLSDDLGDGDDVSLNILYGSVAYKIENSNNGFFFMPELRIGTGVGDDSVSDSFTFYNGYNNVHIDNKIKFEVKSLIALSARAQYEYSNGAYVYVMPSYTNLEIRASSHGESFSDDNWEFGIGAGVGYSLNKKVSVEASYEDYGDSNLLSVGFKYAF